MWLKGKGFLLIIGIISLFMNSEIISQEEFNVDKLIGTHDLSLPDWGPYTKRYIGISHIPQKESGIRFDLSVFPGFYRRKVTVPNVLYENEYHPWETSPNLEYFSFRHELEWKDEVYTDISYSLISDNSRLVRVECVNNTPQTQNLALHLMSSIHFPPIKEYSPYTFLYPAEIKLPNKSVWFDALDYENLEFAKPGPQNDLVTDGKMRGEIRENKFVNGSGIGNGFGKEIGDNITYNFNIEDKFNDAVLFIRYKLPKNSKAKFELSGIINEKLEFPGNDNFSNKSVDLGELNSGSYKFNLKSIKNCEIEFDGFTIIEQESVDEIIITEKKWNHKPSIQPGPLDNSLILKYEDINQYYGIYWDYDLFEIREWFGRDLSDYFKQMSNEHVKKIFEGEGEGHYTNIFLRPIEMEPESRKIINGIVCSGTLDEVKAELSRLQNDGLDYDAIYRKAKSKVPNFNSNVDGEKYKFSIEKLNAVLNSNVVYPVYTQKEYIRHSAPGRWWDCLYTWDSGFIGLGLLQVDVKKAIENLNAYLQEPGAQSVFIHHGSLVPVQFYLFLELWNKTQSKELLEYFYPRLKQYYEFMAGRLGSSTTNSLGSNLLKTWDYFYNSGGWDDYPPQKYVHDKDLEKFVTPVINTAQAIRTAKIMKMTATALDLTGDIPAYNRDIQIFTEAIQKYSWDEDAGYFSYVIHDENGIPVEKLKYDDSVNYNMGLDGAYPLVADICDQSQVKTLLSNLKSKDKLWSKIGLSAVDQSAPYYRIDGYWNGTVWMPHQWFFWKTMLDLGESDFAYKIAKTALDTWKEETEASYNTMEHFLINTGRGAGWHEFGGLSAPILNWYNAYFCQGNSTTGFNIWTDSKSFNPDFTRFNAVYSSYAKPSQKSTILVTMNPSYSYDVYWNHNKVESTFITQGTICLEVQFNENGKGILEIKKSEKK